MRKNKTKKTNILSKIFVILMSMLLVFGMSITLAPEVNAEGGTQFEPEVTTENYPGANLQTVVNKKEKLPNGNVLVEGTYTAILSFNNLVPKLPDDKGNNYYNTKYIDFSAQFPQGTVIDTSNIKYFESDKDHPNFDAPLSNNFFNVWEWSKTTDPVKVQGSKASFRITGQDVNIWGMDANRPNDIKFKIVIPYKYEWHSENIDSANVNVKTNCKFYGFSWRVGRQVTADDVFPSGGTNISSVGKINTDKLLYFNADENVLDSDGTLEKPFTNVKQLEDYINNNDLTGKTVKVTILGGLFTDEDVNNLNGMFESGKISAIVNDTGDNIEPIKLNSSRLEKIANGAETVDLSPISFATGKHYSYKLNKASIQDKPYAYLPKITVKKHINNPVENQAIDTTLFTKGDNRGILATSYKNSFNDMGVVNNFYKLISQEINNEDVVSYNGGYIDSVTPLANVGDLYTDALKQIVDENFDEMLTFEKPLYMNNVENEVKDLNLDTVLQSTDKVNHLVHSWFKWDNKLLGDILVDDPKSKDPTESQSIYYTKKNDKVTLLATLDVKPIKHAINQVGDFYTSFVSLEYEGIKLADVTSNFELTVDIPKGIKIDKNNIKFKNPPGGNDSLFNVTNNDINITGNKLTVKMNLTNPEKYENYGLLREALNNGNITPDSYVLEIPVNVDKTAKYDKNITFKGNVKGLFDAEATYKTPLKVDPVGAPFSFEWGSKQKSGGTDYIITHPDANPGNPLDLKPGDVSFTMRIKSPKPIINNPVIDKPQKPTPQKPTPQKPAKPQKPHGVKTGDSTDAIPFIGLGIVSVGALTLVLRRRSKANNK